jgi:hypothetical protein
MADTIEVSLLAIEHALESPFTPMEGLQGGGFGSGQRFVFVFVFVFGHEY